MLCECCMKFMIIVLILVSIFISPFFFISVELQSWKSSLRRRRDLLSNFKPQQLAAPHPSLHSAANSRRPGARHRRRHQSLSNVDSPPNVWRSCRWLSSFLSGNPCRARRRRVTNRASRRRRTRTALRSSDGRMCRQCRGWLWQSRRRHQRGDTERKASWNAENETQDGNE